MSHTCHHKELCLNTVRMGDEEKEATSLWVTVVEYYRQPDKDFLDWF